MSSYLFDNAAKHLTAQRFGSQETLYDPRTTRFLEATGVGLGWRCLQVGGGSGSIAAWLAERVSDRGHLLVTDIDPRFLAILAASGRPNVQVRRHDIGAAPAGGRIRPLPRAARLRPRADGTGGPHQVVAALKPGGWLVIEDFDPGFIDRAFPTSPPAVGIARAPFAALEQLLVARGCQSSPITGSSAGVVEPGRPRP